MSVFGIHYPVGHVDGVRHYVGRYEMELFADAQCTSAFQAADLEVSCDAEGPPLVSPAWV